MNLTIPLYVHLHEDHYTVRPLFHPGPVERHEKLERVLFQLGRELRKQLNELGKSWRHDDLASYAYCPDLEFRRFDVKIELRRRSAETRFFFVLFDWQDRKIVFTPAVPDLWFEVQRGESLTDRATEVLTHYFRAREKEDPDEFVPPEKLGLQGTAWLTTMEIDIYPTPQFAEKSERRRAAMGREEAVDGESELHRVGRCLDHLYPDALDRVLLREQQVQELYKLLRSLDRRPVLILGSPLVGKTALLHEYVSRVTAARKKQHTNRNNVWLLSPQRLISGMSFVGQWEERLLAILKVARRKQHILYFDDFLGLYLAGQTGNSDLSVAHVLKPYVERREIRMVVEMTPEQFRVLREKDRGFADLFHILRVDEQSEQEILRILIAVNRQLEGQYRCRFDISVLPTVLDLTRRYVRHLSFPGKAAVFLRRLAVKYRKQEILREHVLTEFQRQSGLSTTMLDTQVKLERKTVLDALEKQVIGQPEALQTVADAIGVARARLNDPERPLASLLFLGPTGVGKTQCAKAIADFLYGGNIDEEGRENDPGRLLRFDMNEFLEPGSAARLVGTFWNPEGLLTSAVRRRPFAVILFDEIEKAHPEVFDLLLQVLGEGRLTDALGRTVDFTNTLIVLTSNLGVREAQQTLGFRREEATVRASYIEAAEKFFRPEFFNRLDRLVPFASLKRPDVARIARLLLTDLLSREGLVRRKCILIVQDQAMERVIDRGFDPVLGARALKRAIERLLTQPVATALAGGLPETITVIQIYATVSGLEVTVRGLEQIPPSPVLEQQAQLPEGEEYLKRARAALKRIEDQFAPLRPVGEITAASLAGEHLRYFQIRDHLDDVRQAIRAQQEAFNERNRPQHDKPALPVEAPRNKQKSHWINVSHREPPWSRILKEMAASLDIHEYLKDIAEGFNWYRDSESRPLSRSLPILHQLAECCERRAPEEVVVLIWSEVSVQTHWNPKLLARVLSKLLAQKSLGLACETVCMPNTTDEDPVPWPGTALVVRGLAAWPIAQLEAGTHLICPTHEGLLPIQVRAWPVPAGMTPHEVLLARLAERKDWREKLERGETTLSHDPWALQAVIRIYNEAQSTTLDLRTGTKAQGMQTNFLVEILPLPPELLQRVSVK